MKKVLLVLATIAAFVFNANAQSEQYIDSVNKVMRDKITSRELRDVSKTDIMYGFEACGYGEIIHRMYGNYDFVGAIDLFSGVDNRPTRRFVESMNYLISLGTYKINKVKMENVKAGDYILLGTKVMPTGVHKGEVYEDYVRCVLGVYDGKGNIYTKSGADMSKERENVSCLIKVDWNYFIAAYDRMPYRVPVELLK